MNFSKNLMISIPKQIKSVWFWITLKFIPLRKPDNTSQLYREDLNLYLLLNIKEIGRNRQLIEQICKKLRRQKTLTQIADEVEESPETIAPIIKASAESASEYDAEKIFEHIYGDML